MSIGLVAKLALVTTMIIGSMWADVISPEDGDTPCGSMGGDTYACCVYQCQHSLASGCGGSSSCCQGQCQ